MPPRKRKGAAAKPPAEEPKPELPAEDGRLQLDEATKKLVLEKLADMERSVEEQCEAIRQAAREAVDAYKQEVQLQLVGLPKKVRDTPFVELEAALNNGSGSSAPSAAAAAAAAVQQQLQAAQDTALQSIAAAPGTRSTRSTRARTAAPPAAAPTDSCRTTRRTAARSRAAAAAAPAPAPPVPKFNEVPTSSTAVAAPAAAAAAADTDEVPGSSPSAAASQQQPQRGPKAGFASSTLALAAIPEDEVPESPPEASAAAAAAAAATAPEPAAAASAAAGASGSGVLQDRLASAAARAQARIDAKLASIGGTRTVATKTGGGGPRAPQPGEVCFSRNGSPLSVLMPNVTRTRGRAGRGAAAGAGLPLATPSAAAADGGAMLGSFTIVHKPAAQQPRGRGRRAAGAPPEGSENANPNSAAIVITTKDGTSFSVDATAQSLEAVPAGYRGEVEQQLRLIQDLASRALAANR